MRTLAAAVLSALLAPASVAQEGAPSENAGGQTMTIGELFAQVARAEPIRRAGLRADLLRRTQQIVPTVVIVSDEASYLEAIAGWEGPRRYPVLWDDGSAGSTEDIARFVRAFQPERVVRFEAGGDAPAWPRGRTDRQALIEKTLARAAQENLPDYGRFLESLRAGGVVSPGVVLVDPDDPAWPAAVALGVGRFQPVGFVESPAKLWAALTPTQADGLATAAEGQAGPLGLAWRGIGDDVDAVTLVMNTGVRIETGVNNDQILAVSDRVGRFGINGADERWAWTGQVFGSSAQAAYRAMCALFLTPGEAFIFDGYGSDQPWVNYSGAQAADALRVMGLTVQLHNAPGNTASHFASLSARTMRAGLWMINSHGSQWVLNFPGGKVRGIDAPIPDRPAMAYVVHSFSTQSPHQRRTIAGAMLDRGVYAMLGSVDEPYLQAFVPTPLVARRLGAGMHFAAAVRFDEAPVWKLAVLGDPLITMGPPGTTLDETDAGLAGTVTDLEESLKTALADRDLAAAAETLTLLGRDQDAARLARAAMEDEGTRLTPELAAAAIPALFRDGRHEEVMTAYAHLTEKQREDAALGDYFWFAGTFLLRSSSESDRAERLMRVYQRPGAEIGDAEELAMHVRRRSVEEAILVLEALRPKMTKDWEFRSLDAAIQRVRTGG